MVAEGLVNRLDLALKFVQRALSFFEGLGQRTEPGQTRASGENCFAKVAPALGDLTTTIDESFGIQPEQLFKLLLLHVAKEPRQG